jgi:hypothetical protein
MSDPQRSPAVLTFARLMDVFGQALLPMNLGALIGFYAADQGMRLLPDLLEWTVGGASLALLLILVGRALRGKNWKDSPEGLVLRRRVVGLLVLLLGVGGVELGVWWTNRPAELTNLSASDFEAAFSIDSEVYVEQARGMSRILDELDRAGIPRQDAVLNPAQEALLLEAWISLREQAIAQDNVRLFWEDWYRYDPSRVERSYHLRSFLLTFAAELSLYESAVRLHRVVGDNDSAIKFLDAPNPGFGLPEGSYGRFRQELLGSRDQARIVAGTQYLTVLAEGVDGREEARRYGVDWLWRNVEQHVATIAAIAPIDEATVQSVLADSEILQRQVRRVWFPIQKDVAERAGDLRLRRIGWYLIDKVMAEAADRKMEPGDVLMSRKNWYLSNVALPGFWPHGLLYLGAPDKLSAYFDDPAVRAWATERCGHDCSFPDYLQMTYPRVWGLYRAGAEEQHDWQVIEATSDGVIFNTLEHAAGDYLAAMRPRVDKLAKAQAIDVAFSLHGHPYDFDFDFATDNAVVCTELVYRAYRPAEGKAGLTLPLIELAGRQTLPANDLIAHYSAHAEEPDRQLDFVGFIDASEQRRVAYEVDEATFRASAERSRIDVAAQ